MQKYGPPQKKAMSPRERVISKSTDEYAAREKGLATTEQKGDTIAEVTNTHSLASLRHGKTTHSHGHSSFNGWQASPTPSYSMTRWLAESHLDWDWYWNGHTEVANTIHKQASPTPSYSVTRWLGESHLDWDRYWNVPRYKDSQKPMIRAPARPPVSLQVHPPWKVVPILGIKRTEAKSRILSQIRPIQGTNMHRQDHTSSHSREVFLESESDSIISPDLSHDLSEWDRSSPILDPIRHAMIKQLVSMFKTSYRGAKLRGNDKQTGNPGTQDDKAVGTHGAGLISSRNTGKQPTKRKIDSSKNEGDNGEDGEEKRGTSKRTGPKEPSEESRLLACPFCKWSSHRYRKCYKYILKDIARLKQHLSRCHRIPIHCAVCFDIFDSEDDRDEHLRQRTCEIQNPVKWEGVNEKQRKQLEQRVSKKKTIKENWYIIYAILFPDAPRPKSPYVHIVLSEELCALQDFIAREGPRVLSELVSSELPHVLQPQQDEVEAFVQAIFQDVVGTLLEQWEARNQETNTGGMHVAKGDSGLGSSVNNGSEVEELTSLDLLPEDEFAQNWPDYNDDRGLAFPGSLINWQDSETGLAGWSGMGARNTENDATSFIDY